MLYLTEAHLAAAPLGSRQLLAKAAGQSQALKANSSKGKGLMSVFAYIAIPVPATASLINVF